MYPKLSRHWDVYIWSALKFYPFYVCFLSTLVISRHFTYQSCLFTHKGASHTHTHFKCISGIHTHFYYFLLPPHVTHTYVDSRDTHTHALTSSFCFSILLFISLCVLFPPFSQSIFLFLSFSLSIFWYLKSMLWASIIAPNPDWTSLQLRCTQTKSLNCKIWFLSKTNRPHFHSTSSHLRSKPNVSQ